ncbi:hypothetical protein JCGZ_00500 [Jatropha curcas]|uniref:Aminotransferase-like plant mobile domain-containing protein n=1 Tax=Jatropha curcas TaxID=180498 RepID=A0A067JGU4_JATCU|nr:hypothetical protein JCGZ_00500 [Jatropha curcas]
METLGAIPDIPTFDGEPVPVSRNPLTWGRDHCSFSRCRVSSSRCATRLAGCVAFRPSCVTQLFFGRTVPGRDCSSTRLGLEQLRGAAVEMHGVAVEMCGASVLRMPSFEQLRDAAMELRGAGTEVWAYEYRIYPGGPSGDTLTESRRIPRYLAHCHNTYASTEDPEYWRSFLNERALSDLLLTPWEGEAWSTYPGREVAELHTRFRLLLQGYWLDRYFLGERVFDISATPAHAPPRHMCMLEGMTAEDREEEYEGSAAGGFLSASDYPAYFSTRMQARLPEILEYTQERKKHKTAAHYRAEAAAEVEAAAAPAGPAGVVLGDVPFPPGMEVVLDPGLGLGSGIVIPADLRQAPPLPQLDPEHTTHRYLEVCQRFGFARSFIAQLYSERHERMEVDRLRTRLEVEGIPLDFSKEDDDGSSSDDAPPSPPPQAIAGSSRRRR